jgi:hypothetical protein
MFSLRYKDVKAACAKAVNLCDNDDRVLDYLNEAQERMLYRGKAKGTVQTYRFCVPSSGCIVWPREMRTEWYEFAENGPGVISTDCDISKTLIDRGETCAFDEVIGTGKQLAVYADLTEGAGKYINLQFYNEAGQWVTVEFNGERIDGEQIAIPSTAGTYNYSTNTCKPGGLIRVKKDVTKGIIRLYEYDSATGVIRPLAYYQPDEEVPVYRRSLIPSLENAECEQTQVVVIAKLRFIAARNDESFLMISNRAALRLGCQAVRKEEEEIYDESEVLWAKAFQLLGEQVAHYTGSGFRASAQFAPAGEWGGGITSLQ